MFLGEYFIAPFMRQAWMRHPRLKIWVNQTLNYEDELTGAPDYFVAQRVEAVSHEVIGKPLLAIAEAKRVVQATNIGKHISSEGIEQTTLDKR